MNPAAGTRQNYNLFVMKKTLYVLACALCTLLVLPAASQVPSYVPTDGLVGWWPFNGNANDESGNGNDGVVNGATLTEDRSGNAGMAYSFDGYDDKITVNNPNLPVSAMTVSCWFNTTNSSGWQYLVTKRFSNSSSPWNSISLGEYSPDNSVFLPNTPETMVCGVLTTNYQNQDPVFEGLFNSGVWYQIGFIWDGEFIRYFVNGTVQGQWAIDGTMQYSNLPLYFGTSGGVDQTLFGSLDDIAIYNRALSEQEIQNLYTGTTPPPCVSLPSNLQQGLVGYWPFCGNANDESGNGNDGVVNGATLTEDRFGNAGKAYGFDGETDFIEINSAILNQINNLDAASVSYWFNTIESEEGSIWGHHSNSFGSVGYNPGLVSGAYNGTIAAANSTGCCAFFSNPVTPYSEWHNATIVFDSNQPYESQIKIFIDGTLNTSITGTPNNSTGDGTSLFIGRRNTDYDTYGDYFYGLLDDFGVWNRALTPEEVQELYTLDACTFTVYDTLTVYETVYDTVYTYETIYDTVTTYVTVTDTLLIDITFTGFEGQPSWLNTVTVFPNPASDHITIDYGNFALMAGYNTIITGAAGATVYSSSVNAQQVDIDINAWGATGVYYMSIYDANGALVAVRHIVLE